MSARCMGAMLTCLLCAAAWPAEMMREAAVQKTANGHEIAFTLREPTDVTVRIVDAKGEIVRHLACGMVGLERAAAPFAPETLSQKLTWDGKDNEGKPVRPEGCRAVVLVGMEAKFDKFLLDGHKTFQSEICAFGGSPTTGHWFTAHPQGMIGWVSYVKEFDRDGAYVRTLWPLNPNIDQRLLMEFYRSEARCPWRPRARIKWGKQDYEGKWVLKELHDVYGGNVVQCLTQAGNGNVIAMRALSASRAFTVWDRHGRIVSFIKDVAPWWSCKDPRLDLPPNWGKLVSICSGPEGKLVYVTDQGQSTRKDRKWGWVVGCFDAETLKPVNRFGWSGLKKLEEPVYYLGTLNEPGDDEAHFKAPTGVAIDHEERFWVADADRIKVYDREGKFLKQLDKTTPGLEGVVFEATKLGANHKTGAVYMVTGRGRPFKRALYKIESFENPGIVWQLPLEGKAGAQRSMRQVFVDSEKDLIWVAGGAGKRTVLRVVDKGDSFEKKVIDGNVAGKLLKPQWMRTDSAGNVYVLDMGRKAILKTDIDGRNVREIPVRVTNSDGYFCLDGEDNLYIAEWTWRQPFRLRKFDADGNPLKIGGKDSLEFTGPDDWTRNAQTGRVKGVCVARNGDIYVSGAEPFHQVYPLWKKDNTVKASWVNVYTADGVLKKTKLVQMDSINEIQIGRDGLYVIEAPLVASTTMRARAERDENIPYWTLYSKLQKYSLDGGIQDGEGHLWSHAGVGYVNSLSCSYECSGAQICVDKDDRIWIPEHVVYNVKAVDSAGNLIARIGSYGNADCDGDPNGENPEPAIPITWPISIARLKDYLLIGDRISARIVRCRLEYREKREIKLN